MTVDYQKSIIEKLPQIPYVLDQVGEALDWAKEVLDEGEYNKMLKVTYDVTDYVASISDPHFFKVHYVVATILSNIPDVLENEKLAKFDSASGAVIDALKALIVSPDTIEEKGCFKSVMLHLIPLAKKNMDLFAISLIGIKNDLQTIVEGMAKAKIKTPITGNDYITVLGYALVIANIRMSNLALTGGSYKIYNEITIMLNNDLNY
jgi:hypothetical protein